MDQLGAKGRWAALLVGAVATTLLGCGDGAADNPPAGEPPASDAGGGDEDATLDAELDSGPDADEVGVDADAADDVTAPEDAGPPTALQCFSKWYGGEPVLTVDGWILRFPSGAELVYDDGLDKSFEELLAAPDLQDTILQPYTPGPSLPVTTLNEDPGRFRSEALFLESYGGDKDAVFASTEMVEIAGHSIRVHAKVVDALKSVAQRLEAAVAQDPTIAPFLDATMYAWNWRYIKNTDRLSMHSFGIAVDVASLMTEYWEWDNDATGSYSWHNSMPQAIVDAFEAEWFIWGGRWYHYDTMHFEFRPELFDPDCQLP